MRTFSLLKVILNSLESLLKYNVFLVIYNKFNNSVFIIDMITAFYYLLFKKLITQKGVWYIPANFFGYLYCPQRRYL